MTGEVRFLAPSGERHRARSAQRLEGERRASTRRAGCRCARGCEVDAARRRAGGWCSYRVENRTEAPAGSTGPAAIARSLISTHPILRVDGGRFLSQLDAPCDSVNTWPVLASPDDDVMLGAAIVLPDHPQIAPESRGNLFDNTEIEEALRAPRAGAQRRGARRDRSARTPRSGR